MVVMHLNCIRRLQNAMNDACDPQFKRKQKQKRKKNTNHQQHMIEVR